MSYDTQSRVAEMYKVIVDSVLKTAPSDPSDVGLTESVDEVRAHFPWQAAVCRRYWLTNSGPSFYEVGRWIDGTTQFVSLTPLWASREAAWTDAVRRLRP